MSSTKKKNNTKHKNNTVCTNARCGLCGKTEKLTKTRCCNNWICDDEDKYVPFSYASTSCHRNHHRYTICGAHHDEGHRGDWKTCHRCLHGFETVDYVYFGTNDYNFEKLPNPPSFEPRRCVVCNKVIVRVDNSVSFVPGRGQSCRECTPPNNINLGDLKNSCPMQ